jgi:hypothetical protein
MKRVGYVIFVLTVLLTFLGVGYSAWSRTLNINGTVVPGTLIATIAVGPEGLDSSVEYASIVEGESTDTNLVVVIGNAGAGNVFTINYRITNDGTIPTTVSFAEPVITASGPGASISDILVDAPQASELLDGGCITDGSLTVTVNDSTPMAGGVSYTISLAINASPL